MLLSGRFVIRGALLYKVTNRQVDDKCYVSLLYMVTNRQVADKCYVSLL